MHHTHSNHGKHEGHHTQDFLKKFYVTLVLTVPILLYSDIFEVIFGRAVTRFAGVEIVVLILSSIIFFYGGSVFLIGAYREIRDRLPGMMTLISMAIVSAYAFSVYVTFAGNGHTLFWELATLIAIMLIGHWIEMKAVEGAKGALGELTKLLPDTAEVIRDGLSSTVPISQLKSLDLVLVRPGGKIPADGKIMEGKSEIDESIITGESRPIQKTAGNEVIAGSINGNGSLTIQVTNVGEKTFLSGIMRLVSEAEASKSRLQILSDTAAFYLTIVAVGVGIITLGSWLFIGKGAFFAIERLVAVLVIACPHALGLAVPLVASISTTMGAKNGLLIRRRLALEAAKDIDVVLFDKTGTLTQGEFGVDSIVTNTHSEDQVLAMAASVNNQSEHSLARSIVKEAKKRSLRLEPTSLFESIPGKGAKAYILEHEVAVGNTAMLSERGIILDEAYGNKIAALERQGKTVIHVIMDGKLIGSIALADIIRSESKEAVKILKAMGIKTAMITGDSENVAKWVSEEIGIDEYFAGVLPADKSGKVRSLQSGGKKVAMVGDGINDAPALTQSDLGIAVGAGTNVAIESAGIILVRDDPRDIAKIIRLSRLTYLKMVQNLFWATGYNVIAMPVAAGVLYSYGIMLSPAVAAVLMSLSTVIVAFNAMLLRRQSLRIEVSN